MALTPKHHGFGKWDLLDDGGNVVAGGLTRAEVFERAGVAEPPMAAGRPQTGRPTPAEAQSVASTGGIPTHDAQGRPLTELQRRRLYEKQLEAGQKADGDRRLAPFRALCFALYDDDEANGLWRQIEPILLAGPEGLRREMRRNQRMNGARPAA